MTSPASTNFAYHAISAFSARLVQRGVRHVVISPGSRSTPLTVCLDAHIELRTWVQIDERSAGFFALGLGRATGQPAVLVCTSGTAAANYLPAMVEAYHAGVPLIACTADRPPELRGWGSPQTIDQVGLYGTAALLAADLPVASEMSVAEAESWADRAVDAVTGAGGVAAAGVVTSVGGVTGTSAGPVHLNWPLREPLEPPEQISNAAAALSTPLQPLAEPQSKTTTNKISVLSSNALQASPPPEMSQPITVEVAEHDAGRAAGIAADAGRAAGVGADAGRIAGVGDDAGRIAGVGDDAGRIAGVGDDAVCPGDEFVADDAGRDGRVVDDEAGRGDLQDALLALADLVATYERGVVVAGPWPGGGYQQEQLWVAETLRFASWAGWPVIGEPISGVRGSHPANHSETAAETPHKTANVAPHKMAYGTTHKTATVITQEAAYVVATADHLLADEVFSEQMRPDVAVLVGRTITTKPVQQWLERTHPAHVIQIDPENRWKQAVFRLTGHVPAPVTALHELTTPTVVSSPQRPTSQSLSVQPPPSSQSLSPQRPLSQSASSHSSSPQRPTSQSPPVQPPPSSQPSSSQRPLSQPSSSQLLSPQRPTSQSATSQRPTSQSPSSPHNPVPLTKPDSTQLWQRESNSGWLNRGESDSGWLNSWRTADMAARRALNDAISEGSMLSAAVSRAVAGALIHDSALMLSNSMPVRDFDAFVSDTGSLWCVGNRGASGIDGIVSTALGLAADDRARAVALYIGDLALLHDLAGLTAAARLGLHLTVICVDNNGGEIFSMLPIAKRIKSSDFQRLFHTPHDVCFHDLNGFGGIRTHQVTQADELASKVRALTSTRTVGVDLILIPISAADDVAQRRNLTTAAQSAARAALNLTDHADSSSTEQQSRSET